MTVLEKLTSEILPCAVNDGKFGSNIVKFVDFKIDENCKAADHFSASIYFGDVILETADENRLSRSIVIKAQEGGKFFALADKMSHNIQLYNEFLFYTEILPSLAMCDPSGVIERIFPKCFYAHAVKDDPANHILVFENVQKQGFRMSPWQTFNDLKHIDLTVMWLGKFHALSLTCKRKFPEEFKQVTSKILESFWTEKRLANPDDFYKENCKRGILPLKNDSTYKNKLKDLLALIKDVDHSVAKIITPVEPLAVITHGDFCRNNIFYKYDSKNDPCEVMFFDWATIRYSSPAIDFTYYLFMNSSPDLKANHWNDILQTYYTALTSNPLLNPELQPSFKELQLDLQRRGLFGYVFASYYLPVMLSIEQDKKPNEDWYKMTVVELTKLRVAAGGEVATMYVSQLVKFMIDNNFDFKFIVDLKLK